VGTELGLGAGCTVNSTKILKKDIIKQMAETSYLGSENAFCTQVL
jgi:hypothetical protein